MSKDYKPSNTGSFKTGDFVRYTARFAAKFPHGEPIRGLKGEVVGTGQLGPILYCDVRWDNEPDFLHCVCFDNLEIWQVEF